ncbi:DUF1576 domain-containing protein [Tateyamaria pelophila]|uniref:DUF1576 domain-containing protein n=1 Tax=Tateyamaria pelophila TaxID=328415 RepID=UPI001CBF6F5B|nr:DUF1576 domain-containing protein [Tateyamaria pelophila]
MTDETVPPQTLSSQTRLLFVGALALAFIGFGLFVSGWEETLAGMDNILFARDTLITDYVELGGVGAAFLNAGLLTIIAAGFYWVTGATVGGGAIAALLLVLGFALFGKNLLNIWPILAGVFIYSRFRGEPFGNHLNTAFFGCALAPVVSEVLFSTSLAPMISIPLGVMTGIVMGFIMPPVAAQLFKAHGGYSLYNMGFTAGLIGTLVVAIYISYGFVPEPVFIWAVDKTWQLTPFLMVCFGAMIVAGRLVDRECFGRYRDLLTRPGQSPTDFAATCGDGAVLVNMGVLGVLSTGYVLAIDADLNGPVIGAILSIVGFGAFGKHAFNCTPVVAGVFLATVLKQGDPTTPGVILAALFSTTLAPISGSFGWYWGIVAGMVHVSAAQTVGVLHGGLNLYNNGFAAGFVAATIAPVALAIQARFTQQTGPKI